MNLMDAKWAAHVYGYEVPEIDDNATGQELVGEFDAVAEVFEVINNAQRINDGNGRKETQDFLVNFRDGNEPCCRDDRHKNMPTYAWGRRAVNFSDTGLVDSALFDGVLDNEWGDCEYSQQH